MELSEHLYLLFPNNMKSYKDQQYSDFNDNRQRLESKQTVAKSFLRTPSGNFNLKHGANKGRGTSIGKYWENKTCDSARDYTMAHSQLFTQSNSAKELPVPNGKYSPANSSYKFFKKVEFKEVEEEEKSWKKETMVLNFSKTPKSYRTQKTQSQTLQFSQGKAIKSRKALQQLNLQKSTENSDSSNAFIQKQPTFAPSTLLNFKASKLCLSQLVNKDTYQTQLPQIHTKQPSAPRRGSFYTQQKDNNINRGQGLPTHVVARQVGGGAFSNSYPTNNPFLKFKVAEKIILNKSKVFSNQNFGHYSSSGFESYKQLSEKDIYKPRKKPIQKGEFQIGKRLGKGKYGDVYLVRHRELGFICAMKIIQKDLVRRQNVQNQICRQMKISDYINNPNVTTLYGYFHDQNNVYLLMELCSSGNLFQLLKERKRFAQKMVVTGIKQICMGVEYLHTESIIHRDIKPENIIVENGFLKLCDFGWAVYCNDRLRSTFCGTPLYVSPEVLKGDEYNQKIDIWAVGILTYELLIGRVPFKINTEADMAKIIHEQIQFPEYIVISDLAKDFILKILDRDPSNRIDIQQMLNHPFLKQECPDLFLLQ